MKASVHISGIRGFFAMLLLLGMALAPPVRAALIGHDSFDYSNGVAAGRSGGADWDWYNLSPSRHTGNASTWDTVTGFNGATTTNYALTTTGTAAAKREFGGDELSSAFRSAGAIYFRVAMKRDAATEMSGLSSYDFNTERLFFGVPAALNGGTRKFAIQLIDGNPTSDDYSWSAIVPTAGREYTLVAKLDFDNDLLSLWVDPVFAKTEAENTHSLAVTRTYTGGNWSTAVRLASTAGTTTWDKLTIATTWAELAVNMPLQVGLTSYWPFDGDLTDRAGRTSATANTVNDNGTFAGPAGDTSYGTGKMGQCLQSNGGAGYVSVPGSADTTGASLTAAGFTVAAWFRADAFDAVYQTLIAHGEGTRWRVARYSSSGKMGYAGGVNSEVQSTSSFTPPTGWVHLAAVTRNGIETKIYINGELEASMTGIDPYLTGSSSLFIGANPEAPGREWRGGIDEVALWRRALDATEISMLYQYGNAGYTLARACANTFRFNTTADENQTPAGTALSLREAIRDAAPGDIVEFDYAISYQTVTLGSRLTIDKDLTVGAGSSGGTVVISGNNSTVLFEITSGSHKVSLNSFSLWYGNAVSGIGGAIINRASLALSDCFISSCAGNYGAAVWNSGTFTGDYVSFLANTAQAAGGGLRNEGTATLHNSRFYYCSAAAGNGGGISNTGTLTLIRSSITGGFATSGGGIANTGTLSLVHCTLADNTTSGLGGGLHNTGTASLSHCSVSKNAPGGIYSGGGSDNLILAYSLVAGNSENDLSPAGNPVVRQGVNLIGNNTLAAVAFPAGFPNVNGDFVGTAVAPIDPGLAMDNNHGGLIPRAGSPAIDRITPTAAMLADTDQIRRPRVLWGMADIGAVEAGVMADGVWEVRDIFRAGTSLNNLSDVNALIANPASTVISSQAAFINRCDPEASGSRGYFGGDEPITANNLTQSGLADGDDDNYATAARCFLNITEEGDYTFGFSSDDGARLRVFGATFTSSTRLNTLNPSNPAHNGDTLTYSGITGDSRTLGVCHLAPGVYPVEFVTWDNTDGSYAEVFFARGARTVVDWNFRLIGDWSAPALSPGPLVGSWEMAVIRNNASSLTNAISQVYSYLSSGTATNLSKNSAAAINHYDPDAGSGGRGVSPLAFPGNVAGDENHFAMVATAKLQITTTGYHTFCANSDDGLRFRIRGSSGWTVSSPNAAQTQPVALVDGFQMNGWGGDVFGRVYLTAGTYDLELIYFEAVAGAYVSLWGATGKHDTFDTRVFSLVGQSYGGQAPAPACLTDTPGSTPYAIGDEFENALVLTGFPANGIASTDHAYFQPGEPGSTGHTVWWRWQAPASLQMQVNTLGSDFPTVLDVFTGAWGALDADGTSQFMERAEPFSQINFYAHAGMVYHFQVGGVNLARGLVRINLGPLVAAPSNDAFAAPIALGTATSITAAGDNSYANEELNLSNIEPARVINGVPYDAYASVWYAWTAPYSGRFFIDTMGSSFSTVAAVYRGSGTQFSGWQQIAGSVSGRFMFDATAGTTYRIAVDGNTSMPSYVGDYVLAITPLPEVVENSITNMGTYLKHTFGFRTEPYVSYRVESSPDLMVWTRKSHASTGTTLRIPKTVTQPKLFYRVTRE